jgi:hypothetical protein
MVRDVTSTLEATVKMSVTRQDSTARRQNATTKSMLDMLADLKISQAKSDSMLLKIYNIQQQQQNQQHGNVNHNSHQQQSIMATARDDEEDNEDANGGEGIGDVAVLLQEEPAIGNADGKVSFTTKQARSAKKMGMNQFQVMLPDARMPKVDGEFPVCWKDLVDEWELDDLQSFTTVKTTRWKSKVIVQRYTKRYRAMRVLRRYIRQVGDSISEEEAAIRLDTERNCRKISLSKHMLQLFQHDNTVK